MSMLPVWEVKPTTHNGAKVFTITCPSCGDTAIVSRKWTMPRMAKVRDTAKVMIVGRVCTYCFKTAQVPEQFKGGKPRG